MMAVVCSELQEDYFLSSIATTLFTDMEEGEVISEDNSYAETTFDISGDAEVGIPGPLSIALGSAG